MAVLSSPHLETVTPQMLSLLAWLGRRKFLRRFYLGGGTALALQLGHRRSVDLDFFSETDPVHKQTRQEIITILVKQNGQVIENADGNLLFWWITSTLAFSATGMSCWSPGRNSGISNWPHRWTWV